jgi:hypothetical protein
LTSFSDVQSRTIQARRNYREIEIIGVGKVGRNDPDYVSGSPVSDPHRYLLEPEASDKSAGAEIEASCAN